MRPRRPSSRLSSLSLLIRSARTLYALSSGVGCVALVTMFVVPPITSPAFYWLDVFLLATWTLLFATAAIWLDKDPAGWSAVVAGGTTMVVALRLACAGFGSLLSSVVLLPIAAVFVITVLAIAFAFRSTSSLVRRHPDHRVSRRLRGDSPERPPGRIRQRWLRRVAVASRRARQRAVLYFAGTMIALFVLYAMFLWVTSPPPLEPFAERFVSAWNEDAASALRQFGATPWLSASDEVLDLTISMPEPFHARSLHLHSYRLTKLLRDGKLLHYVYIQFPIEGRSLTKLECSFRRIGIGGDWTLYGLGRVGGSAE